VAGGAGHPPQVRSPLTFSETPITRYAPPPELGEHNDDVRRQLTEETTP
jgi:crotonobetainyl-CoA:carnitine CoA-transferase CaiB-like acyl-CoA transferase